MQSTLFELLHEFLDMNPWLQLILGLAQTTGVWISVCLLVWEGASPLVIKTTSLTFLVTLLSLALKKRYARKAMRR